MQATAGIARTTQRLNNARRTLSAHTPAVQIQRFRQRHLGLHQQLVKNVEEQLTTRSLRLAALERALQAVSPLNTLQRGYSIVQDENGRVITQSTETAIGESLRLRLMSGELRASVTAVEAPKSASPDSS